MCAYIRDNVYKKVELDITRVGEKIDILSILYHSLVIVILACLFILDSDKFKVNYLCLLANKMQFLVIDFQDSVIYT